MKRTAMIAATAIVLVAATTRGETNIIQNGGFEDQIAATQPERFYGGSQFEGWEVGGTASDFVDLHWDPGNTFDGNQYLYMRNGSSILQLAGLQIGQQYALKLHTASSTEFFASPPEYILDVISEYPADTLLNSRTITHISANATYRPPFASGPPLPWNEFMAYFTAQSNQERLSFRSSGYWLLVDGISLVEIPEPRSALLSMVGLAIAISSTRRRLRI